jgi:hypothetical protein
MRTRWLAYTAWIGCSVLASSGLAEAQGPPIRTAPETAAPAGTRSKPLGEIVVTGSTLDEERAVGPYNKPEYVAARRFTTTRVYLQTDPGEVQFEQWLEIREPKDTHKDGEVRLREEFEFGLADGVQLDLYAMTDQVRDGTQSGMDFRGWSAEVRYAPWKWNEVFGNPTAYFEYALRNGVADVIEPKLLLGGEVAPGWHWGANLVYERELATKDLVDEEFKVTGALSYTILDRKLSAGIELEADYAVERVEDAGAIAVDRAREVHVGPSIQWRPLPQAHLDLVPLFGCTGESKRMKTFIVFGWKF